MVKFMGILSLIHKKREKISSPNLNKAAYSIYKPRILQPQCLIAHQRELAHREKKEMGIVNSLEGRNNTGV